MSYTKLVNKDELEKYQKLAEIGVTPKILDIKKQGQKYKLTTTKYPMTFIEYFDNGGDPEKYKGIISERISQIHSLGILHGDLHGDNIVLDPDTDDLRVIDFGRSSYFDDINDNSFETMNEFLTPDTPFQSLDDVIEFEKTMYLRNL